MNPYRVNPQLWSVDDFFSPQRFAEVKHQYRKSRLPFSMQYDDRLLTPWADTPTLQVLVSEYAKQISEIIQQPIAPQVAYVSIDLAGSAIMMHRLHPDIFVQVQVCMAETSDHRMSFGFCHNREINTQSEIDYRPQRTITRRDVDIIEYQPNLASVYVNEPRGFVGMLAPVPENSVREVLILSYTRAY